MEYWYLNYWSQRWYSNTFLVHHPKEIAHCKSTKSGEWNNITDSGCNITCLAMIVGIDPAHLVHCLSETDHFFIPDETLNAIDLNGKNTKLVWDRNAPNASRRKVDLYDIWHPAYNRADIEIRFVKLPYETTPNYEEAKNIIQSAHAKKYHVILGPDWHSYLAAGRIQDDFFLWDPNCPHTRINGMLNGGITLSKLFTKHKKTEFEFYIYKVSIQPK